MATKRAAPRAEAEDVPTADEIHDAIESWRAASHARKVAYDLETEARVRLCDVLHRAGLHGFSL